MEHVLFAILFIPLAFFVGQPILNWIWPDEEIMRKREEKRRR